MLINTIHSLYNQLPTNQSNTKIKSIKLGYSNDDVTYKFTAPDMKQGEINKIYAVISGVLFLDRSSAFNTVNFSLSNHSEIASIRFNCIAITSSTYSRAKGLGFIGTDINNSNSFSYRQELLMEHNEILTVTIKDFLNLYPSDVESTAIVNLISDYELCEI